MNRCLSSSSSLQHSFMRTVVVNEAVDHQHRNSLCVMSFRKVRHWDSDGYFTTYYADLWPRRTRFVLREPVPASQHRSQQ
jgi:hypothetical protein